MAKHALDRNGDVFEVGAVLRSPEMRCGGLKILEIEDDRILATIVTLDDLGKPEREQPCGEMTFVMRSNDLRHSYWAVNLPASPAASQTRSGA